jgi:hypothetical protein
MLPLARAEAELIDEINRVAQRIAAAEFVFDLAENLTDLIFDRVGAPRARLEGLQIRKEVVVGKRSLSTKAMRSGPVRVLRWSRPPSSVFGAAQAETA